VPIPDRAILGCIASVISLMLRLPL
jgi:hypothetical protein